MMVGSANVAYTVAGTAGCMLLKLPFFTACHCRLELSQLTSLHATDYLCFLTSLHATNFLCCLTSLHATVVYTYLFHS